MNALASLDDSDPSKPAVHCRAHKFGGSSMADAQRIRHVADLLLADDASAQIAITSAMQGTTNALVALGDAATSGGKWKPGELNRFEHFAMKYLLPLCLTRPHFVAYCAAEDGNLSMWLEKKLFRPYLAAWTIRDQKLMDRVQKEYDYPIFELFAPKEKQ